MNITITVIWVKLIHRPFYNFFSIVLKNLHNIYFIPISIAFTKYTKIHVSFETSSKKKSPSSLFLIAVERGGHEIDKGTNNEKEITRDVEISWDIRSHLRGPPCARREGEREIASILNWTSIGAFCDKNRAQFREIASKRSKRESCALCSLKLGNCIH